MSTPNAHALLSASAAHRWLVCTAAPRFEAQFPSGTSEFAEEGTLAHAICELYVRKHFTPMAKRSKRAQREHYAAKRGSWNGLSPVTRVVQSKKTYDRNRVKREARRANDTNDI